MNANGNPVTNVGVPTSLNDAINGNVLQDALRDDGNYEYKMYMTVITITSQLGDATPRWKELQPGINPNVAGWNTQFHDELFICLNDGWIIVEEYTEEKVCTWKSFPATEDCDIEKDKGCKITVPCLLYTSPSPRDS